MTRGDLTAKRRRQLERLAAADIRAQERAQDARVKLHDAIREAATEGASTRVIGKTVSRSHVWIGKLLKNGTVAPSQ
jgi:hypothetical protein